MLERITSLQNPRIKKAIRLQTSRGRQTQNRMIVFGEREVSRAIQSNVVFEELFFDEDCNPESFAILRKCIAPPRRFSLSSEVFQKISYGDRLDGVVGIAIRPSTDLTELTVSSPSLVVVAQAIEKPGNLGAIVRTADACGVSAILLADPLTDFFHPNAIRSSTGTVFGIPVATATTAAIQSWLRENQLTVYTAILDGATDFFETELADQVAIVLGNESQGLTEAWVQPEYHGVKLPMGGLADSLNVSVTASVMIFEARRQQNACRDQ